VAAGYRLQLLDSSRAAPARMTRVEVLVHYEAFQDAAIVNLRSVTLTSACARA
jgi:hypothetical protein